MNWTTEKPEPVDGRVFASASWIKQNGINVGYWDYSIWTMVRMSTDEGAYIALCDGMGEEWGDLSDMDADKYCILPAL